MESNAAFVWADSIVVLNAVTTVYANRTVVVFPANSKHNDATGSAIRRRISQSCRSACQRWKDTFSYFLHSLMELSLAQLRLRTPSMKVSIVGGSWRTGMLVSLADQTR